MLLLKSVGNGITGNLILLYMFSISISNQLVAENMRACFPPRSKRKMRNGKSGKMGLFIHLIFAFLRLISLRCPGGESVEDMQCRVDTVISKVWRLD